MTLVRSRTGPNKYHLRQASGYSLRELDEAKILLQRAKQLKIKVDHRRKSSYPENVQELKRHA